MTISRSSLFAVTLAAATLLTAPVVHAAVDYTTVSGHPMSSKTKNVQLLLRNDTGVAIELQAGETIINIAPGKTVTVKLPEGTRLVDETATAHHNVGDVLVQVSSRLSGTTVVIG
jgi:hypothetical protein